MSRTMHGRSATPEYRAWINMIERCNYDAPKYQKDYQARGIAVFPEWRASFPAFLAHIGERPSPGHSVDRIDGSRGYEPGNVRWATRSEQQRNRTVNRIVTVGGRQMSLAEACQDSPVPYNTVLYRLKRGWSAERAVSRPAHKGVRP